MLANLIDRELALPQRNAALLLAQAVADAAKKMEGVRRLDTIDNLLDAIDELRGALKAITAKP